MKRALCIFASTVLCLTVLTSCDFSRGLIGEMFGQSLEIDPQVGEIYTTDGGWNTKCECTDPYHHEGYPVTTPALPDVHIQQLTPNGEDLTDWNDVENAFSRTFAKDDLLATEGELTDEDGFTVYTVTDSEYLYFGFDVSDRTVANSEIGSYDGDHFVITLDLGELCQSGSEALKPVSYTFGKCETGCFDVAVRAPGDMHDDGEKFYTSRDGSENQKAVIGGVRVKTQIEGAKIVQIGWTAEFGLKWDLLIADLERNVGATLAELDLSKEKLYAVIDITYVDMDKNGNEIKSYSIDPSLVLILYPYEMIAVSPN